MKLEIVTPERVVYTGEVDSVSVPGVTGQFQMLDNHAPIVSILTSGYVKIFGQVNLENDVADSFIKQDGTTNYKITGGVLEMVNNKAVVLAD